MFSIVLFLLVYHECKIDPLDKHPDDLQERYKPPQWEEIEDRSLDFKNGFPIGTEHLKQLMKNDIMQSVMGNPWEVFVKRVGSDCQQKRGDKYAECIWRRWVDIKKVADQKFYTKHPYRKEKLPNPVTWDHMAVAYVFMVCKTRKAGRTCPSPCAANPCKTAPNVDTTVACQSHSQIEDDYSCKCAKPYSWNKDRRRCEHSQAIVPATTTPETPERTTENKSTKAPVLEKVNSPKPIESTKTPVRHKRSDSQSDTESDSDSTDSSEPSQPKLSPREVRELILGLPERDSAEDKHSNIRGRYKRSVGAQPPSTNELTEEPNVGQTTQADNNNGAVIDLNSIETADANDALKTAAGNGAPETSEPDAFKAFNFTLNPVWNSTYNANGTEIYGEIIKDLNKNLSNFGKFVLGLTLAILLCPLMTCSIFFIAVIINKKACKKAADGKTSSKKTSKKGTVEGEEERVALLNDAEQKQEDRNASRRSSLVQSPLNVRRSGSMNGQNPGLNAQHSGLNAQHSGLNAQHSGFSVQRSALYDQHVGVYPQYSGSNAQRSGSYPHQSPLDGQRSGERMKSRHSGMSAESTR